MNATPLFAPLQLNEQMLRNRIIMPAINLGWCTDGIVHETVVRFYEKRAAGGTAICIFGGCAVDPVGMSKGMAGIYASHFEPGLARLASRIHDKGCLAGVQLFHAGRYARTQVTGIDALAPSAIPSSYSGGTPLEMTTRQIEQTVYSFARSAARAKHCGFDAVEISASAGYLLSEFLSPITNRRTDHFGGTWKNRLRFPGMVLDAVRESVGEGFPIIVRIAGNEFISGGGGIEQSVAFARFLCSRGADAISVTGGWHEAFIPQLTGDLPPGGFTYLAAAVKRAVHIPVFASNRINDPETANAILASGAADGICIGRGLIADPDFPQKAMADRFDEIRPCIACGQGCTDRVFKGKPLKCSVNPGIGRQEGLPSPAQNSKRILVVGGGPAGMETAAGLAERGHRVFLWEREAALGGALRYIGTAPGKRDFLRYRSYLVDRLYRTGVEICLEREATPQTVLASGIGCVVVATGAALSSSGFPDEGFRGKVYTAGQVLERPAIIAGSVVVVGGGEIGCDAAICLAATGQMTGEQVKFLLQQEAESPEAIVAFLRQRNREVIIVESDSKVGAEIGIGSRWTVRKHLGLLGVVCLCNRKVQALIPGGLRLVDEHGAQEVVNTDCIVLAQKLVSETALYMELEGKVPELYRVGGAMEPGQFYSAVAQALFQADRIS